MDGNHTDIALPFPDAIERRLLIRVGACRLRISRGGGNEWVAGTYDDPTGAIACRVSQEGGAARITQEPHFSGPQRWARGVPTFDLALGTALPYSLAIETGASDTDFELGGLPLTRLAIKLGAGKNVTRFLEPNPQPMVVLDLDAGAGSLELQGLANANFADLTLDGGAAVFTLDFGGTLQRSSSAYINTGMSAVEVRVPSTTAARVIVEPTLAQVDAGDGLSTREGGYWTAAAIGSEGPTLTVQANVALGTLKLRVT